MVLILSFLRKIFQLEEYEYISLYILKSFIFSLYNNPKLTHMARNRNFFLFFNQVAKIVPAAFIEKILLFTPFCIINQVAICVCISPLVHWFVYFHVNTTLSQLLQVFNISNISNFLPCSSMKSLCILLAIYISIYILQ